MEVLDNAAPPFLVDIDKDASGVGVSGSRTDRDASGRGYDFEKELSMPTLAVAPKE
jgi:hypothetical protein